MLIYFKDSVGRPLADMFVSVVESPVSMPDLGMITDAVGSVSVDIPVPGHYIFQYSENGIMKEIGLDIEKDRRSFEVYSD